MKYKYFFVALLSFFLVGCTTLFGPNELVGTTYNADFQSVINTIYANNPTASGIMVHIEAPDESLSWSGAVGYSDKKNQKKINPNQPALIGSNTKMYVSVAILRLIEDGKLGLYAPIENLLSARTKLILQDNHYDLKAIKIVHLLSHTGGIQDYVNDDYMRQVTKAPEHRWTRNEQIALAMKMGDPLNKPGKGFSYADVNYLLLTEIIEQKTGQPFYTSIRKLLNYRKHRLKNTWFYSLEPQPKNSLPLVHQYAGELGWDSYAVNPSFDLYGGGGIAATTKDLARFCQLLFEKKIIKDPETLNLIYTDLGVTQSKHGKYLLGLTESEINGYKTYGHGGFWGTGVQYFPELNTSISVFVLNRDQRRLRKVILEELVKKISSTKPLDSENKVKN